MNTLIEMLTLAIDAHASDLHLEPLPGGSQIRIRINGILSLIALCNKDTTATISAQLKIMADLDIAEKRQPQDGKLQFNLHNELLDIRISTCPTIFGEKIVLRFLSNIAKIPLLPTLGFSKKQLPIILHTLNSAKNLILVTGTTGSGKTTTLYSMLKYLFCAEKNICTIEDPVEINFPGTTQVNVNYKLNLTFSKMIRCFLRQDPDIILIGEIRDPQTAQLAIQAARIGCLVLASMHASTCSTALKRLSDFGVTKLDLNCSISLILNQHLVLATSLEITSQKRIAVFDLNLATHHAY